MTAMRILIVHAHPEPRSFSGALTDSARALLPTIGHELIVSDLYAMEWDPVSDRRNFTIRADPERYDQQGEERFAASAGSFSSDLRAEMDKLLWADTVIFQFPIWWLGMPAIMKGWIDRVFAVGVAYGGGKWLDQRRLAPRRAMLSVTTGGGAEPYSDVGLYGPIDPILYPIHHGILRFTGFQVIEPFIVYGPSRMTELQRAATLAQYRLRLMNLASAPTLPVIHAADYENFVRRQA